MTQAHEPIIRPASPTEKELVETALSNSLNERLPTAMVYEFPEGRVIVVMKPAPQEVTDIELRQLFPLTRRESEVATLLLQRLTNKEIAATLGVAQSGGAPIPWTVFNWAPPRG
jgi:DNA-binding NarL/FixJ family response regulator